MKVFIILLSILVTSESCNVNAQNETTLISYEASTRGSSIKISITPERLIYNDEVSTIKTENWNSIINLLADINLDTIHTLEAPSQNRFRDAAMAAQIKITTSEQTFISSQFDHGNPPEDLSLIVKEILSLANIIDKE